MTGRDDTRADRIVWPATDDVAPPPNPGYGSAVWLLGRHQHLANLAARIPGVVTVDDDGPTIDLETLAEAITGYDAAGRAWADYERYPPAPDDDRDYDQWLAAGPQPAPAADAYGVLSSGEKARLRVLAVFATHERVPVQVGDFAPRDHDGARLLADWCQAVQPR